MFSHKTPCKFSIQHRSPAIYWKKLHIRSLLGPRLFGIKVIDLPECTDSGTVELFADDTESYCIGDSPDKVTISLQKIILDIHMWCRKNGLTIHPDKTEAMIISQKSFIGALQALKLGNHYVKFVTKSDCLGMTVDNNLNWKAQVERVSKTLSSKLKILRRMKCLSTSVKESIYFKGLRNIWNICMGLLFIRSPRTTGKGTSQSS